MKKFLLFLVLLFINAEAVKAFSISVSKTDVTCNNANDGTATVLITGGTGPFTFDWGGSPAGDGTATITGLDAGTYTVKVTDTFDNSVKNGSTSITEPAQLDVDMSFTQTVCNGSSNGTATADVSFGTGSYAYDWLPGTPTGDGTSDISGLSIGTYTVTVTDDNLCQIQGTVTVTLDPSPTVTTSSSSSICSGSSTTLTAGGASTYT